MANVNLYKANLTGANLTDAIIAKVYKGLFSDPPGLEKVVFEDAVFKDAIFKDTIVTESLAKYLESQGITKGYKVDKMYRRTLEILSKEAKEEAKKEELSQ